MPRDAEQQSTPLMVFDAAARKYWLNTFLSGNLSPDAFAARHPDGPSGRTLRGWASTSKGTGDVAEARAIITEAIERLQDLLHRVDGAAGGEGWLPFLTSTPDRAGPEENGAAGCQVAAAGAEEDAAVPVAPVDGREAPPIPVSRDLDDMVRAVQAELAAAKAAEPPSVPKAMPLPVDGRFWG